MNKFKNIKVVSPDYHEKPRKKFMVHQGNFRYLVSGINEEDATDNAIHSKYYSPMTSIKLKELKE